MTEAIGGYFCLFRGRYSKWCVVCFAYIALHCIAMQCNALHCILFVSSIAIVRFLSQVAKFCAGLLMNSGEYPSSSENYYY